MKRRDPRYFEQCRTTLLKMAYKKELSRLKRAGLPDDYAQMMAHAYRIGGRALQKNMFINGYYDLGPL